MQTALFDLKKVIENESKYSPLVIDRNMYIFKCNNQYYAFNYGTCFFYLLSYSVELECYSVKKQLNYYLPEKFTVWTWIIDPKTNQVLNSYPSQRN